MKGNILIIEDVVDLADVVARYLAKEGFEVTHKENAEDALVVLESWEADLVILYINLPGMDGFEFLEKFRKKKNTPVLILSARTAEEDQITGFGIGADEFITKPFSPRLLTARVRALFRRMEGLHEKDEGCRFPFGPFVLATDACALKKAGKIIPLSVKEYAILAFLAGNTGKFFSPEAIYDAVWKGLYGDLMTVAVHIQRIRKKIEADPANPVWLVTVRGMGYKLNAAAEKETEHEN
jgi:two-component system response regulator RegX3